MVTLRCNISNCSAARGCLLNRDNITTDNKDLTDKIVAVQNRLPRKDYNGLGKGTDLEPVYPVISLTGGVLVRFPLQRIVNHYNLTDKIRLILLIRCYI
jgi:hypothetical protein